METQNLKNRKTDSVTEQTYSAFQQVNSNLIINKKLLTRTRSGGYVSQPQVYEMLKTGKGNYIKVQVINNEVDYCTTTKSNNNSAKETDHETPKMHPNKYWASPLFDKLK